jgi:small-conductance mechanosensitive channel/CRP-like cAMP-binding protein
MEKALHDFIQGYDTVGHYGLLLTVLLLIAARQLLPPGERKVLRQPVFFLVVHLAAQLIKLVTGPGPSARVLTFVALLALLLSLGRASGLLILDILIGRKLGRPLPRIIRDIAQGLVYIFLLLAALRAVGFDPSSILTTGAVVTAVIGLSLQDTLGNLVAGLAIQVQRPFDIGDWIQFDDDERKIGKVVEINWRATKVVTLDEVEVTVPNGTLAKTAIVNFTKPTAVARRSVFVSASYDVAPRRVHEIIMAALEDIPGVVRDPALNVVTHKFGDSGVEYWVRFYTDQFHRRDVVDGAVRDRIWYALQRAAIVIPYPQRKVHLREVSAETRAADQRARITARERALRGIDVLSVVSPEERLKLAETATTRLYAPGETVVHQGDADDELFIIERGEVAVLIEGDLGTLPSEVTRLKRGQFFGEMALITGERRRASVRALTECELVVIGHDAFQAILTGSPHLAEELSRVLAERQHQLDEHAAGLPNDERASMVKATSGQLLDRIKSFFSIE